MTGKAAEKAFAVMIAAVMALTMFTGVTDISHASSVNGAKAANYGFRMVRVSWSAVKVEIPQEPADTDAPGESTDPAADPVTDSGTESTTDSVTDPAADPVTDPAADPVTDPAADPDADSAGDPVTDPAADLVTDPAADPAADSVTDPAANPDADPVTDPVTDTVTDPALQVSGDMTDQVMEPAGDTDDPAVDQIEQPAPQPVYDVITYKVYRATSRGGTYKLIRTTKATSCIDKGLTIGKTYYYKVSAFKSSGEKYGTSSIISIKVAKHVTANMTLLMKGNAAFNYRIAAKQRLYQYDTLQGGCANGGYAYLTLYNRRVEKCKIVKVKLSDRSIVKVSAALPIFHGNNLTYDTKKKLIVATCGTINKKAKNRVVLISPKTLKVVSTKNIKLTKKVKKLPKRIRKKNKGFTAVAYNEKHNCYVARLRQNGNIVILNKNLKPLKYIVLKGKKTGLLAQGIETYGNYIYDVRSFKGIYHYCMVTVHTMSGKYVGQMKFPYRAAPGKELQCIFHNGKQFYAGIYYSTIRIDDKKKKHVNRVNLLYRLNNLY